MLSSRHRTAIAAALLTAITIAQSARLPALAQSELGNAGHHSAASVVFLPVGHVMAVAGGHEQAVPPAGRIMGRIIEAGQPAPAGLGASAYGPHIELRRYEAGAWRKVAAAETLVGGRFVFLSPPPLSLDQAYQVWWTVEPGQTGGRWLERWMSLSVETYQVGDVVDVGTFEVADTIELHSPRNHGWVSLPQVFQWQARAHGMDSYRWQIATQCGGAAGSEPPWAFRSWALGHKSSFKLAAPPPGLEFGRGYCWRVIIDGGLDGSGWSHDFRTVAFCSSLDDCPR